MLTFILTRLREPSTWAGLAGLLAAVGLEFDPTLIGYVTQILVAVASIAAMFLREKSAPTDTPTATSPERR